MKKLSLNCGSCAFLANSKLFERPCRDLGKLPASKSCTSHKPDTLALVGQKGASDRLQKLAVAVRGMSPNELQVLAAVLASEKTTRKVGWRFYQKVYVRVLGSSNMDYFSNFAVGYVVYADKEYVRIIGKSGKMMVSAINERFTDPKSEPTTVFTVEEFRALAQAMVKAKRFTDMRNTSHDGGASVRMLDDVLETEETLNKTLTKAKTRTDDLVSIVAKMTSGFGFATKKSRKARSSGVSEIRMDWSGA